MEALDRELAAAVDLGWAAGDEHPEYSMLFAVRVVELDRAEFGSDLVMGQLQAKTDQIPAFMLMRL